MTASILSEAEDDLQAAFDYYRNRRPGLGSDFVDEFRQGVERILEHPNAWQPMDTVYRRYRLHRFPFGIVYRVDPAADGILVVAVMHLSREPTLWKKRTQR